MPQYRLQSNPRVYAPGIVKWAKAHYWHEPDQPGLRNVITAGWKLPIGIAHKLLAGEIDYTIEDETVVFEVVE
jgi:hypothetical protein